MPVDVGDVPRPPPPDPPEPIDVLAEPADVPEQSVEGKDAAAADGRSAVDDFGEPPLAGPQDEVDGGGAEPPAIESAQSPDADDPTGVASSEALDHLGNRVGVPRAGATDGSAGDADQGGEGLAVNSEPAGATVSETTGTVESGPSQEDGTLVFTHSEPVAQEHESRNAGEPFEDSSGHSEPAGPLPAEAAPSIDGSSQTRVADGASDTASSGDPADVVHTPSDGSDPGTLNRDFGDAGQETELETTPEGPDAVRGEARRDAVSDRYPADYSATADQPPRVDDPHQSPESWSNEINPDKDAAGRDNNCGDCARAVQDTWEGDPRAAHAMSDADSNGEVVARMSEWAGHEPQAATFDNVQDRLTQLGPGSSAVVGVNWDDGRGHWFNAVNENGAIKAVDGQSGLVEAWPPSDNGLGFSEADTVDSDAIYFDSSGRVVK